MVKSGNSYRILDGKCVFLDDIKVIPLYAHAPEQVFLSIENRCIYNCPFCTSQSGISFDDKQLISFAESLIEQKKCNSIAITSGVYPNNRIVLNRMVKIIEYFDKNYPDIPIGVEPLVDNRDDIIALKNAGADEIKINVQFATKDIFNRLCSYVDYDSIHRLLEFAVQIFGEGKVTSNIIYGLGERDEEILQKIDELASLGVVPTLRKIRINDANKGEIENALGYKIPNTSFRRILNLAIHHKRILKKHNLSTKSFKTMCHPCGCCDIVPFIDL
ncbi:MAG TPA: biotin synthase [Thermoplasmatales archaeon]|nr:biotin synthase [Thermoplasmatales archaeon]